MGVLIRSDRDKKWWNLDLNPTNRSSHSAPGRHSLFFHTCTYFSFSAQFGARPCTGCLGDTEVDKTVSLPPRSSESSPPPPPPVYLVSFSVVPALEGATHPCIPAKLDPVAILDTSSPSPSGSKCPVKHNISEPLLSHL